MSERHIRFGAIVVVYALLIVPMCVAIQNDSGNAWIWAFGLAIWLILALRTWDGVEHG